MGHGKKRIDGDKLLSFRSKHGQAQEIRPMFQTLKSNLARPATIPRARAAETGQKRILIILWMSPHKNPTMPLRPWDWV